MASIPSKTIKNEEGGETSLNIPAQDKTRYIPTHLSGKSDKRCDVQIKSGNDIVYQMPVYAEENFQYESEKGLCNTGYEDTVTAILTDSTAEAYLNLTVKKEDS